MSQGCYGASGSCIGVQGLDPGSGFHIYYVHDFAVGIFARLSLQVRALSGGGSIQVAPSRGGTPCQAAPPATVGPDWSQVTIDLATACTNLDTIGEVTLTANGSMVLLLDEIHFEK